MRCDFSQCSQHSLNQGDNIPGIASHKGEVARTYEKNYPKESKTVKSKNVTTTFSNLQEHRLICMLHSLIRIPKKWHVMTNQIHVIFTRRRTCLQKD